MNKSILQKLLLVLTLLFGAMPAANAADRLYVEASNFEPGETKTISVCIENGQPVLGFQFDIALPDGLNFVSSDGKAVCTLSSRANSSYTIVSNLISINKARIGSFSLSHTPLSGSEGPVMEISVTASDNFSGGTLSLSGVLLVDADDNDVELPDFEVAIGNQHVDKFYIPDFSMLPGETKEVAVVLDNETPFSAFQTDIYLPEGLSIVNQSLVMADRGSGHAVSAKAYADGRVRIACLSLNNTTFNGSKGPLVHMQIAASDDISGEVAIRMENSIFSTADAREHLLSDAVTRVSIAAVPVGSITLNHSVAEIIVKQTLQLSATILPTNATVKDIVWSSNNPSVATVDEYGLVTAISQGEAIVTAVAADGSDVSAQCSVSVIDNFSGVSGISDNDVSVRIENSSIIIEHLPAGVPASIFNISGICIGRQYSTGEDIVFEVDRNTVYILTFGEKSYKLCLQ